MDFWHRDKYIREGMENRIGARRNTINFYHLTLPALVSSFVHYDSWKAVSKRAREGGGDILFSSLLISSNVTLKYQGGDKV